MTPAAPSLRILVIDDDLPIRRLLRTSLGAAGYRILEAETGAEALQMVERDKPDLIVLELCLPDIDGREVIRSLRTQESSVPVIVLSIFSDENVKVEVLDLGADDYLTKPFGVNELLVRIRLALRHRLQQQGEKPIFRVGELSVDLVRRIVSVGGSEVKLSPIEYDLLRLFVAHAGKVLTHKFILNNVWGYDIGLQYLRQYIRALRRKLEPNPDQPRYILTETKVGYRLRGTH